jgi:beta-lactam-binding protein with PASTA domain
MRAILIVLVVIVIVAIAAVATGFVNVNQTKTGALPSLEVKGGQAPAFDVQTANVSVRNETTTITTPTLKVEKPK